jgi:carbonic anhydrase
MLPRPVPRCTAGPRGLYPGHTGADTPTVNRPALQCSPPWALLRAVGLALACLWPVGGVSAQPPAPAEMAEADPLERMRLKLKERLSAVPVAGSASPYDLRVGPTPAPAGGRVRAGGHASGASGARAPARAAAPEWAYEGAHGPDHWGGLCATGQRQSPVDLTGGLALELEPVVFQYRPVAFSVTDTGRTVQVDPAPGNALELQGRRWALQRITLHRPSEDSLDGRRFEMSVHLEHRDAEGQALVLSVLVGRGAAHPVLQTVFNHLPLEKGRANAARVPLDLDALLPHDRRYLMYMGSLSVPPCTEGVLRVVMRHPVSASAEQIALFARLFPMNARPLQPLSGRRILQSD